MIAWFAVGRGGGLSDKGYQKRNDGELHASLPSMLFVNTIMRDTPTIALETSKTRAVSV
jgi:hypothetical protein